MIEHNKYKKFLVVLLVLIVFVVVLVVSRVSYAYLARETAKPGVTSGVVGENSDQFYFTNTKGLSLKVNADNFKLSDSNITATATPSAILIANRKTKTATRTYNSGIDIIKNTFVNTSDKQAELILTVKKGTTEITSCGSLTTTTVNGVKGFDITNKTGLFICGTNVSMTSTNTNEGAKDTWTYTVTFINKDYDQVENENAEFEATIYMQEDAITAE